MGRGGSDAGGEGAPGSDVGVKQIGVGILLAVEDEPVNVGGMPAVAGCFNHKLPAVVEMQRGLAE